MVDIRRAMMGHLRVTLVSLAIGLLSASVFLIVFAATALPAVAVVEDDHALVTWSVLAVCAAIGWAAARFVHRRMSQRWFGASDS